MFRQLPKFIVKDKDQNLEEKLYNIRRKLVYLPPSKHGLLHKVEAIRNYLATMEQLDSKSKHVNILLVVIPLAKPALLRHPDREVRLVVAQCIVQVMRITAPYDPYNREVMKEVFQLIV